MYTGYHMTVASIFLRVNCEITALILSNNWKVWYTIGVKGVFYNTLCVPRRSGVCRGGYYTVKANFGKVESIFDVAYLIIALIIGCILISRGDFSHNAVMAGQMALVLGFGDAFHLVPRVVSSFSSKQDKMYISLGFGKQVTSITMTVFYLMLWLVGLSVYNVSYPVWSSLLIFFAVLRIVLCLLPQNEWLAKHPPVVWGIIRNIPFFIMGLMVIVLFFVNSTPDGPLPHMWLAILLSFAFYAPVVLWAHKYRPVGMCMAPKTCMYIWALWMCLGL